MDDPAWVVTMEVKADSDSQALAGLVVVVVVRLDWEASLVVEGLAVLQAAKVVIWVAAVTVPKGSRPAWLDWFQPQQ